MLVPAIATLFGCIIGSFLNVLILRHGSGRGISGRSACMSCGHTLYWYDLVPVVSYLAARGRCRYCRSRISAQYPLVEAGVGLSFGVLAGAGMPPFLFAVSCVAVSFMWMIAIYDLRHTIIPDRWAYLLFAFSLLYAFLEGRFAVALLAALLAAAPFFLLWLFSRGRAMGLGDAKLALGVGALVGIPDAAAVVLLSFMLGGAVGALLLLVSRPAFRAAVPRRVFARYLSGFTMKSEVPFGPFLIVACLIVWLSILYQFHIPLFTFVWSG